MKVFLIFGLGLLVALSVAEEKSTNATVSPDDTLKKPANDSLARSPVAYNQGSLLTAFPAVVRIKPKKKKSTKSLVRVMYEE